jgi:hypothetical protein
MTTTRLQCTFQHSNREEERGVWLKDWERKGTLGGVLKSSRTTLNLELKLLIKKCADVTFGA